MSLGCNHPSYGWKPQIFIWDHKHSVNRSNPGWGVNQRSMCWWNQSSPSSFLFLKSICLIGANAPKKTTWPPWNFRLSPSKLRIQKRRLSARRFSAGRFAPAGPKALTALISGTAKMFDILGYIYIYIYIHISWYIYIYTVCTYVHI